MPALSLIVARVLSGPDQESRGSHSSEEVSSASRGASCIGESEDRDEVSSELETRNRTFGITNRKDSEELPSVSEDVTFVGESSDIEASVESASGSVAQRMALRILIR